ncbi:MAG: hypothetical protein C4320_09600, partial [Armatimonadota bacterium]
MRISGEPSAILDLRARGYQDFLVDLPTQGDWSPTLAVLAGARAILSVNSVAPMVEGYTVLPQSYRVEGITTSAPQTVALPGVRGCYVVIATRRDGALIWSGFADVKDGLATFTPKVITGADHVALLYPLGPSLRTEDLWEGMDRHRDALLSQLRRADRSSFRGILDPMGAVPVARDRTLDVIPTSAFFRAEVAEYLSGTYRNVLYALQSWALTANDVDSFETLARLVPLWNGTRGVDYLLDPETKKTYRVERRRSAIWRDLNVVVTQARERRTNRLLDALRRETGLPLVKSWQGWSADDEGNRLKYDGLAFIAAAGGVGEVTDSVARPLGTLLRRNSPGFL